MRSTRLKHIRRELLGRQAAHMFAYSKLAWQYRTRSPSPRVRRQSEYQGLCEQFANSFGHHI